MAGFLAVNTEPDATAEAAADDLARKRQAEKRKGERMEQALRLREALTADIHAGADLLTILPKALEALALATDDPEWGDRQREALHSLFSGIQPELLKSCDMQAAEALQARQREFFAEVRKTANRHVTQLQKLQDAAAALGKEYDAFISSLPADDEL